LTQTDYFSANQENNNSPEFKSFVSENKSLLDSLEKEMSSGVPSFDQFQRTIIGGTFDFFHSGHKMFLSTIALQTQNGGEATVGITQNSMLVAKSYSGVI
jgi:hypothetical protein